MALEDWIKLNDIHIELIGNYEISLQKIKRVYLQAKEILTDRLSYFSKDDVVLLLDIFIKGSERVSEFWKNWRNKGISPTDQELDLFEEAFEEASWVFNQLSENFPHLLSPQASQIKQQQFQKNKKIIAEERQRRENPNPNPNPNPLNQTNNSNNLFTKENVFFFFFFLILAGLVIAIAYKILKKRVRR